MRKLRQNLGSKDYTCCTTFKKGHQAVFFSMQQYGKKSRKNEEISAREFAYQWPLKTWKDEDEGLKCRLVLSIKFLLSLKFEGCVSKYVLKGFFH